jgi:hypothetical protein
LNDADNREYRIPQSFAADGNDRQRQADREADQQRKKRNLQVIREIQGKLLELAGDFGSHDGGLPSARASS